MIDNNHTNDFRPYLQQMAARTEATEIIMPVRQNGKSNVADFAGAIDLAYARITALPVRHIAETNPTASWVEHAWKEAHAAQKPHKSRTEATRSLSVPKAKTPSD